MHKALSSDAGSGLPSEEALRTLRIPFVRRVSVTHRGRTRDTFIIDLGLAGVFVELDDSPDIGEPVVIAFSLPDNEIPVTARCRVAWRHAGGTRLTSKSLPPGVGLEFVELPERDRERIRERVVEHCRRPGRARHFLRHWPQADRTGDDP